MTTLVAVRTGSAAILAADSKLTTQALAGKNPDGSPRWLPQTYDYANKIAQDATRTAVAAFAGNGNIGEQNAADYFSRMSAHMHVDVEGQDLRVRQIAAEMTAARAAAATKLSVPVSQLPGTIVLLTAPPNGAVAPRLWRIELQYDVPKIDEVLQNPGVWFEGSVDVVMGLMYGALPAVEHGIRGYAGIDPSIFDAAKAEMLHYCPITQVNFWTMPVQDAMDFAAFCTTVQVEMDRFRPGIASSGGPIDLVVLEMAPTPAIRQFPGKVLHHPVAR
jgi:hypothetical protein